MTSPSLSTIAACGIELPAVMNGSWVAFDPLPHNTSHVVFDNQGTVPIAISTDGGTTTWRTFPAGEAIVFDLRAAHGIANDYTFRKGMVFYGNGASGTFSISYLYPQTS